MKIEDFINENTVINDKNYEKIKDSILCPICLNIIIDPKRCMICKKAFCAKCLDQWTIYSPKCPIKCNNSNYQIDQEKNEQLSKLKFKCKYCNNISEYNDMKNHYFSGCDNFKSRKNSLEGNELHIKREKFQKLQNREGQILESRYKIKSKK